MEGWIKLYRKLENHWIAENNDYFHWWCDLLFLASYSDKTKTVHSLDNEGKPKDDTIVVLRRGQIEASVAFLVKRWMLNRKTLDRKTVMRFLSLLEEDGMIKREVKDGVRAIITITNYDTYQGTNRLAADISMDDLADILADIPTDIIKEYIKKDKNKEKDLPSTDVEGSSGDTPDPALSTQEKIDFVEIINFFNRTMDEAGSSIRRCKSCEGRRKDYVRARVKQHGIDAVYEMITKASVSDFLNGRTERPFLADFEWLFRPTNFQKVLEGNYDNGNNSQQQNRQSGQIPGRTQAEDPLAGYDKIIRVKG